MKTNFMEKEYKVQKTKSYSKFRRLEGNRKLVELRVKKIMESIKKVGYIPSPIVVNEKWEVIDGQGRLEAVKRLDIPVWFIQVPGIGVDECIAMNINQGNWTMEDYIESYAETGNISYMYLLQMVRAYKKEFTNKVVLSVAMGKNDNSSKIIKNGEFQCDDIRFNNAMKKFNYLEKFKDALKNLKGHKEYYYMALAYCYEDPEIDNERMVDKMTMMQANLIPVSSVHQALKSIEEIYNNRIRGGKVYILNNYQRYLDNKYSWYQEKWGKIYE